MAGTRYAIVGGGIVGASVAYHIGERTDDSVVYERERLAAETTFRSTAMIGVSGPDPYHRMKEYGLRLYNEFFADPAAEPQYRQSGRLRVATSAGSAAELADIAAVDPECPAEVGEEERGATTDGSEKVDTDAQNRLRDDLGEVFSRYNRATDGTAIVENRYAQTVAVSE